MKVVIDWIKQFGSPNQDYAHCIATDYGGNIYLTGVTEGAVAAGPNAGGFDAWIAKYNPEGDQLWIKQLGSAGEDYSADLATDGKGNVYLTGSTSGALEGRSAGGFDIWVAKYDLEGNQQWIQQFGSVEREGATAIATDSQGNVYLTGWTAGVLAGSSSGGDDIWIAKYDSKGNQQWIKQLGSADEDHTAGIATDGQGNVYLAGWTAGMLAEDSTGEDDIWLAKYDLEGNQLWISQFGSPTRDRSTAIATDGQGNVYLTGWTAGALAGHSAGETDTWIAKYDAEGNQLWVDQFGSADEDRAWAIAIDSDNNAYLAGWTSGTLEGNNAGGADAWIAKYDPQGKRQWIKQFGSASEEYSFAIAVDNGHNIYLTGHTSGDLEERDAGGFDAWIVKLHEEVVPADLIQLQHQIETRQRAGLINPLQADRASGTWHREEFKPPFEAGQQVVVIPMTQTYHGNQTPGLRIRNVDHQGFEIRFDEVVDLHEGKHVDEIVGWVAYAI